jgi:small subunit ribosomal protein S1
MQEQRAEDRKKILDTLTEGQVIQGVVKNITNYGAFVDIGGVDGLLHITDMTWGRIGHPSELIKIGDTIPVKVLSFDKDNEKISLGMKQLTDNPWEKISSDIQVGSTIKGKISSITDYGLFVEVAKGVEGLVHISEISWTERINDLHKLYKVGQEIEALVTALDKDNRRMSLSIKQLSKNPWEQITQQFKIGQTVKGKISNITDFGLFVELVPGIDGLVHVSDISWTEHIEHPSDMYKKGAEVEAIVLGIDEQNKRISLGIKQLSQDPWETIEKEYPVNSIIEGEVSKITNFGAFIKLPTGIEGLIHKSQFGDKKVEDVLKIGQKTQFRVLRASKEDHKLGLSLNLDEEAPREERLSKEKRAAAAAPQRDRQQQQLKERPKSVLQVELEKVAARKQNNDEDEDEEQQETPSRHSKIEAIAQQEQGE